MLPALTAFVLFAAMAGVLLLGFRSFDAMVRIEHERYREEWLQDGQPSGFFWYPPDRYWLLSDFSRAALSVRWVFLAPTFALEDDDAAHFLRRLRLCTAAFWIGWLLQLLLLVKYLH